MKRIRLRFVDPSLEWAAFLAMALLITFFGVMRYHHYWSGAFDIGVYDQGIWLLAHGHAYEPLIGRNVFADHVAPIFLASAAIYRLYASVYILIVVQAFGLAATIFPLVRLAKYEGLAPRYAIFAVGFSAPLWQAGLYDFHTWALAAPGVAWALLGARSENRRYVILGCAFVLCCRADLVFVLLAIAIVGRRSMRPIFLGAAAVGLVMVLIPALLGERGIWLLHFSKLGPTPLQAVLHPERILGQIFSWASLTTMVFITASVAFISLRSWRWLLSLGVATLPVIMDGDRNAHTPWFQYGAPLAPIAIGGLFVALTHPRIQAYLSALRVGAAILPAFIIIGPVSPWAPDQYSWRTAIHINTGTNYGLLINSIPKDAVVSVPDQFVAHMSHRAVIYSYAEPFVDIGEQGPIPTAARKAAVQFIITKSSERVVATKNDFTNVLVTSGGYVVLARSVSP